MSNIAIKSENISKAYQLGEFSTGTLSYDLERFWARLRGKEDPFMKIGETNDRTKKSDSKVAWSLRDINFEIQQGDAVGIIGRNGAGKSTLLKLLSKVTSPTTGKITGIGRIASLLEVGTGFHPELTGRENIFLNGAILGMRKKEITRKFSEIVEFSGVERYIDTPVKRYSSGMYVRLAFAVAAHLESEILIVDEVLAVGDADFQKKCLGKMGEVSKGQGRTVLFVSHNISSIIQLCNKGLLFQNGNLIGDGLIMDVVNQYSNTSSRKDMSLEFNNVNKYAYFRKVSILNEDNIERTDFLHDEPIKIAFRLEIVNLDNPYTLFVLVLDNQKNRVFASEIKLQNGKSEYALTINPKFLVRGEYSINGLIHLPKVEVIDFIEDTASFTVLDNNSPMAIHGGVNYGSVFGNCFWT